MMINNRLFDPRRLGDIKVSINFKRVSSLASVALLASGLSFTSINAEELVKYEIVNDNSIPASLTGTAGDAKAGRAIMINRKLGNCLACHSVSDMSEQQFHGKIGPLLDGVADRYSEGELRMLVVNSKQVNPDTFMPAFYRTEGLHMVLKKFEGKTILSAQQVEDVVAYLATRKEPASE